VRWLVDNGIEPTAGAFAKQSVHVRRWQVFALGVIHYLNQLQAEAGCRWAGGAVVPGRADEATQADLLLFAQLIDAALDVVRARLPA
jgi:hypothetical protein